MELREGNYYIARNGELVGPMVVAGVSYRPKYTNGAGGEWYNSYGVFGYDDCRCPRLDITDTVDNAAREHVEGV